MIKSISLPHFNILVQSFTLKTTISHRSVHAPVFRGDLRILGRHIHSQRLNCATLTSNQIYIFVRDKAMFRVLFLIFFYFFARNRVASLLLSRTVDILRFPDNSGFFFNHFWTGNFKIGGCKRVRA